MTLLKTKIDYFNVVHLYFKSFYGDRFGHDKLHLIKDSNIVERDKLDQAMVMFHLYCLHKIFLLL